MIPPPGWKATSANYEQSFGDLTVRSPIEQSFSCKSSRLSAEPGVFQMALFQKKSMSLQDYIKRVKPADSISDGKEVAKVEKMVRGSQQYWKSLRFDPPLYGADVRGSLFEDGVEWNLNKLRGLLEKGLGGTEVPGINVPYFYFGAWRTTFGWHCEDFNLPSINFLHYGKPK